MIRNLIKSTLAVFFSWQIIDFIAHSQLMCGLYQATKDLWRPEAEMLWPLMMGVSLVVAFCFVAIYAFLIKPKSLQQGLRYGILYGFAAALPMAFGTYSFSPIPLALAWGWFFTAMLEFVLAGLIVGALMKDEA
jgi:hypothetical protein